MRHLGFAIGGLASVAVVGLAGCGGDSKTWQCKITSDAEATDFLSQIGCMADFQTLASQPIDATIPGARSTKVVLDTFPSNDQTIPPDTLYFQNSNLYKIHHAFASKFLTAPKHALVDNLGVFNSTEYSSAERRFVLGAVTYYEGPKLWTLELSPYDTANADMITRLYNAVKKNAYFGAELYLHPTSEAQEALAKAELGKIPIKTTNDIFAATDYQPLNLASTIGKLKFYKAAELETTYVGYRDVVVLDRVPNDVSVVAGMITEEFQTPLSHVNVLAQNRGTPNMGLRNATTDPQLLALEGKWVELVVGAEKYTIKEKSQAEADAWWEANKPAPVTLPTVNLEEKSLKDLQNLVVEPAEKKDLKQAIQTAILAYGTKASNYGVIVNTKLADGTARAAADPFTFPIRPGFAIPVFYYHQFMEENGFFARVTAMVADPSFKNDPAVRDAKLAELRAAIIAAPVNAAFSSLLRAKLDGEYPGMTMRFRTSTNAEDLDGFPCAGCYDSQTGDPANWDGSLLVAIKTAWAGVWFFRTFEEREFHSIDHNTVHMALLVHHNYPMEEANGVALTANPFDASGADQPAFYVNVQYGGAAEVVHPPPDVTSDAFLFFFYTTPNRPITYLGHSSIILTGETVLTPDQILELGTALNAIHERFSWAYGPKAAVPNNGYYAMDCEFKFDDDDDKSKPPRLYIKQARPYHGRGE